MNKGKYTMQPQKEHYESFYGKRVNLSTKSGIVQGRIEKVVINELDGYNLFIYVRDISKNLHKIRHEQVTNLEEDKTDRKL